MILPILCTAACLRVIVPILNVQGMPFSAGFEFSGFVGLVAAINATAEGWSVTNILFMFSIFVSAPVGLSIFWNYIFVYVLKIIKKKITV